MKCKYCNAEVQPNVRFCTTCGGDLSKFDKCVNCGEFIDKGISICPNCGAEQHHNDVAERTGSKKWMWAVIAVILLAIIGGGAYFATNGGFDSKAVDSDSIEVLDPSDSIAIDTDIHSIEGIKARLNDIFTKALRMPDDAVINKYFSQEFKQLNSQVEKVDATFEEGPGFWNGNIWDGGQDGNPDKLEIVGVSTSSASLALADVYCKYQNGDYQAEHKISMVLIFENGNWFIDGIDGNKDQMKEYIKSNNSPDSYSFVGKVYKGGGNGGGLGTEMIISFYDDNQCTCVSDWYQAYSSPKTIKGQYEIKNNMVIVKCKDGDIEHLFEFEITSNGCILKFDHSNPDMGGTMGNDYMSLEVQ